jgi:hypothetical protein
MRSTDFLHLNVFRKLNHKYGKPQHITINMADMIIPHWNAKMCNTKLPNKILIADSSSFWTASGEACRIVNKHSKVHSSLTQTRIITSKQLREAMSRARSSVWPWTLTLCWAREVVIDVGPSRSYCPHNFVQCTINPIRWSIISTVVRAAFWLFYNT